MFSSLVLGLCAAQSAIALTLPAKRVPDVSDLAPGSDDLLILLSDGTRSISNYTAWAERVVFEGVSLTVPEIDWEWLNRTYEVDVDGDGDEDLTIKTGNGKRQNEEGDTPCDATEAAVVDKTEHFIDWDVQMSNVACASNGPMDIQIMKGWTVTNTISVSAGLDFSIVKDLLGGSLGVDYSRAWATQDSLFNKGTVNKGECGVMITKPQTTRRYGRVMKGCPGSTKEVGTFMADDRGTGKFDKIEWISGAVGMCAKPGQDPPLSLCRGKGNFV